MANNASGIVVKSLGKALKLFKLFTVKKSEWSVKEMALALKYHPSSIQRVVTTLETEGFLERLIATRSVFRLGPQMLQLANVAVYKSDVREAARPALTRLVERAQETAHLCVVDRSQCYYIDKAECSRSVRIVTYVGQRLPLHSTGVGKALMSGMSVEEVDKVIAERGLPAFTKNTITDRNCLLDELAKVRREGIAYDFEESEIGLICVAAPIFSWGGKVVAGISVSAPKNRVTKGIVSLLRRHVRAAAMEVSSKLGYVPPDHKKDTPPLPMGAQKDAQAKRGPYRMRQKGEVSRWT